MGEVSTGAVCAQSTHKYELPLLALKSIRKRAGRILIHMNSEVLIMSASFSAILITRALVLPVVTKGVVEAFATRGTVILCSLSSASTTGHVVGAYFTCAALVTLGHHRRAYIPRNASNTTLALDCPVMLGRFVILVSLQWVGIQLSRLSGFLRPPHDALSPPKSGQINLRCR